MPGCLDEKEDTELLSALRDEVKEAVAKTARGGGKGRMLDESIRGAVRKLIRDELGKKPVLDVHVHSM